MSLAHGRVAAVIDVGSNSVRLLAVRELTAGAFEVLDEERFDARLGQSTLDGELTPEGMERGLRALRVVSQVAKAHHPSSLVAVGTEALRRANNTPEFLARVHDETGLRVRVLSPREEAFASFVGVANATGLTDGHIVDIGGGSLELMEVRERSLASAISVPLGAIYATERYFAHDPPANKEVRALRKAVRQQLDVRAQSPVLFGVGGAVRNLARIVRLRRRYPLRRLHGLVIQRREVRRLVRELLKVPAEERRRIPGVSSARADILPAAAVVIEEVLELTGASELYVSGQGLREGIAWQQLRGEAVLVPDVRSASVAGLAAAHGVDPGTANALAATACTLFDATCPAHGLGPAERELLAAAARLIGTGSAVDYYSRDRHAQYLVQSGPLHGFSHREIVLLSAIVRWADSGTVDLSPYKSLVEADDARCTSVLAAILGLAGAIHRRGPGAVDALEAHLDDATLHLVLRSQVPLDAELLAVDRQSPRFESALKLALAVHTR